MESKLIVKTMKGVEHDYDLITKEWDISRKYPRGLYQKIAERVKSGMNVLDAGCGNGLLYDTLAKKSIKYTGLDLSRNQLKMAQKRINRFVANKGKTKFIKGSVVKMPFANDLFDKVFSLAVLQHLPGRELQLKAIKEMCRVLKKNGEVVLTVWNLYSDYAKNRFKIAEQLKNIPKGWSKKDLRIPWKATPKKIIWRYIYRFKKDELADLFKEAGFKNVRVRFCTPNGKFLKSERAGSNIFLTAKK